MFGDNFKCKRLSPSINPDKHDPHHAPAGFSSSQNTPRDHSGNAYYCGKRRLRWDSYQAASARSHDLNQSYAWSLSAKVARYRFLSLYFSSMAFLNFSMAYLANTSLPMMTACVFTFACTKSISFQTFSSHA